MVERVESIAHEFYPLREAYAEQENVDPNDLEELTPYEEEFITSLDDFELVATGAARCLVTPTDNDKKKHSVVYKLARSAEQDTIYDGREQNEYEAFLCSAVQEKFTADERPQLLPVLDSSDENYWVKMPFTPILLNAQINPNKQREIKDTVLGSLRPIIDNVMLAEISSDNIGKYNGEWYLVDYGSDPFVAESL